MNRGCLFPPPPTNNEERTIGGDVNIKRQVFKSSQQGTKLMDQSGKETAFLERKQMFESLKQTH